LRSPFKASNWFDGGSRKSSRRISAFHHIAPRTASGYNLAFQIQQHPNVAALRWRDELGTQFLKYCDRYLPLNRDRLAQGLDPLNLVEGLRREVRLPTVWARP
jgi:hypothetical protein